MKEDHETELADKDIAISHKGEEEDSHQTAKEDLETSVLVSSKETETEPSSENTDTEKV